MNRLLSGAMWVAICDGWRGRVRLHRRGTRRDDRRGLARRRGGLHVSRCVSLLLAVHRGEGLRARSEARDAGRAPQQRPRLRADQPVDPLRSSLLGDLGCGPAGRSDARRAVWISSRDDLAHRRRRARRCGSGLPDSVRVDASRWQVARSDREGRSESRRGARGHGRDLRDHDHPARRAGARRGQRAA